MIRSVLVLLIVLMLGVPSQAGLRLISPFTSHMVLQRDMPIPVWGEADPGEPVKLIFAGKTYTAVGDSDRRWQVQLDAMPASSEPASMEITTPDNRVVLENIVIGDVWILAGDNSAETTLPESANADQEVPVANYPLLRVATPYPELQVRKTATQYRSGEWQPCFPQTANFSALAYYFGRDVQQAAQVPIGVFVLSMHSCAEAWCSAEALDKHPKTKAYADAWRWIDSHYKAIGDDEDRMTVTATGAEISVREYREAFAKWQREAVKNRIDGKPISDRFPIEFLNFPAWRAPMPMSNSDRPGTAFNVMLAPLFPLAFKGIIWQHGYASLAIRNPVTYRDTMEACITDWRQRSKQKDLPILISQMPSGGRHTPTEPVQNIWAVIREQQALLAKTIPNVWTTVTIDTSLPDEADWMVTINKEPTGRRLAALALKTVYGKDVHASGPEFELATIEDGQAHIRFKSDLPLAANPRTIPPDAVASATPNSELKGFAIAGEDQNWVWADARIDGKSVIAWSEKVKAPVAVRYAWTDFTFGNLTDSSGLPAAPFRTDDWRLERGW